MIEQSENEQNWRRLLTAAYIPCRPDSAFKTSLLAGLKEKQRYVHSFPEDALRTILNKSYQPVEPRRAFETRLLHNLKERQRTTTITRRSTRRRTLFLSAASSVAAAAMVLFVFWVMPETRASASPASGTPSGELQAGVPLPLPEIALRAEPEASPHLVPVAFCDSAGAAAGSALPAVYAQPEPRYRTGYTVAAAFDGPALPSSATVLRNVETYANGAWQPAGEAGNVALAPGEQFRAVNGMGHLEFPDGSLLSLSPDSQLAVTGDGLSVSRGFVLLSVPESSEDRFRLHFPERDIAVEPGTELAVMVEDPALFAEGGAPAPMVMVVDRPGEGGGLALARGEKGVGPLFASHLYRLDRYVTPDLPGRPMCDTEYQDLDNLFKAETVRETLPMAAFAGGFSGNRDLSYTATVLSPAGFAKKGDRWVADTYRKEPTTKIAYLSDEYFGFANERRDLSRALSLGPNVIVDGGDGVFYEIHK